MTNSPPGEFASSSIRAIEKEKERVRRGEDVKGASWTLVARGRGREGTKGVRGRMWARYGDRRWPRSKRRRG